MCRVYFVLLCSVLGLFSPLGCGRGSVPDRPKTIPVKVTVTYGGKPVQGATVTFVRAGSSQTQAPEAAGGSSGALTNAQGAVGQTDANGQADMWTFEPGDGVVPGSYRVAVRKMEVLALPNPETVSPEEYTRLAQQMSAPPKSLLPARYSNIETSGLTAEVAEGSDNSFNFDLRD